MNLIFKKSNYVDGVNVGEDNIKPEGISSDFLREEKIGLPQLSELEVMRHYKELGDKNFCVESGMYPLGSCTMKYNPKVNEYLASLDGFTLLHPLFTDEDSQGSLQLMYNLQEALKVITGMDAVTLQPAAGAHGELTGMMIIKKYFESIGEPRTKVIIPDSGHGTNPASAMMCGYQVVQVKSNDKGLVDVEDLKTLLDSDVAAIMNCTYDKAIERQQELGWVVFHAFDILYYKGVRTERMPLVKRKEYLDRVVETINQAYAQVLSTPIFPYIREVPFYQKRVPVTVTKHLYQLLATGKDLYPTFYKEAFMGYNTKVPFPFSVSLSHRAYYEYVVMAGGEGVMLKPLDGRYYHKRGREYQKIKKFLTREVIITGFIPPTREYTGKFPSPAEWNFWESKDGKIKYDTSCTHDYVAVTENIDDCMPVTKYHYLGWIGNFEFGVTITDEEIEALPKNKKFEIRKMCLDGAYFKNVIIVGECSGFDEEMRSYASEHKDDYLGKTMEVMANEIFKDTGKLRHPRFMRMRSDKSPLQCTWADHVG